MNRVRGGYVSIFVLNERAVPRQEGESCRGVGQRIIGALANGIRGGCRRCGSRGLGWWRGAGSLRRRSGESRESWFASDEFIATPLASLGDFNSATHPFFTF